MVCFRLIYWVKWSVFQVILTIFIFFHFFRYHRRTEIFVYRSKNENCQNNLKGTLFDSVFYAESESVFRLWLKVLFEFENRWIPLKMAMVRVKMIFLDKGKKRKKKRCIGLWLGVWWVKRDTTFPFIAYMEKLDRFTKWTYTYCTRHDSKRHHQWSFGSIVYLITCLYSVFDGESEKNYFQKLKKG